MMAARRLTFRFMLILVVLFFEGIDGHPLAPGQTFRHPDLSVTVGQRVVVPCHTDRNGPVFWRYQSSSSADSIEIAVNGAIVEEHKGSFDLNESSLVIKAANWSGTYTCIDGEGFGNLHETQLSVHAPVLLHPRQTVDQGQSVTISCHSSVNFPVIWWYQKTPDQDTVELYVNGAVSNDHAGRLSVRETNYSLVIRAASLEDGGTYRCIENNGFGPHHVTQLRVLEIRHDSTMDGEPQPSTNPGHDETSIERLKTKYVVISVISCVLGILLFAVIALAVTHFAVKYVRKRKKLSNRENGASTSRDSRNIIGHNESSDDETAPLIDVDALHQDAIDKSNNNNGWTGSTGYITSLQRSPATFRVEITRLLDLMGDDWKSKCDVIVGMNANHSNGHIFAQAIAERLNKPCTEITQAVQLSVPTVKQEFATRYSDIGKAEMQIVCNALNPREKIIIVDDELGRGYTVEAAVELMKSVGVDVLGCLIVTELMSLGGRQKLEGIGLTVRSLYPVE